VTITVVSPGFGVTSILGGQVIEGASVSVTVMVNMQEAVLPEASVAVAVTVVVPSGKALPEGGIATTVTPGQLSVAPTLKLTTAAH
jgi:hypothetical protein